jgi:hypothetical protein
VEPIVQMKREFFVAYDYGMGGAWGIAAAESESAVKRAFPELQVQCERPEWMTDDIYAELRKNSAFTVDDESTYPDWILSLIRSRSK